MSSTSTPSISQMLSNAINGSIGDSTSASVQVMGIPYRMNALADPSDRMYSETFLSDICTVSFYPGKPKYRKTDPEIVSKAESFFESDSGDGEQSFLEGVGEAILGSTDNLGDNKDYRYYHFEEDYNNYLTYLNLMLNVTASTMGIGAGDFASYFGGIGGMNHGIAYYAGTQANISESFSNSFGDSQIANVSKTMSDAAKEMQFLFGANSMKETGAGKLSSGLTDTVNGIIQTLGGSTVDNVSGELNNGVQSALSGMNMAYPQIWKDSSFSRSYSMTFEFYSPYGNPDSIFGNVYVPFLSLLALAAPRQFQTSSYGSPFLCRVDCPGFFTSDLAVITSIDWKKGGQDNLWSKDGLPLAMTVSVSVADLFPIMFASKDYQQLAHNTGLHGFLNNMAGFNISAFKPFTELKAGIEGRAGFFKTGVANTIADHVTGGLWKMTMGRHVNL